VPIAEVKDAQTLFAGVILTAAAIAAGAASAFGPAEKKAMVQDLLKSLETRDPAPMRFVTTRSTFSTIRTSRTARRDLNIVCIKTRCRDSGSCAFWGGVRGTPALLNG
jgi:hypothetical protein